MIIRSSSPLTVKRPANGPFFSVILAVLIPLPPRPLVGYSPAIVRLPYPFSVMTNTSSWSVITLAPTTLSPSRRFTPRTPVAERPIFRTTASLKRTEYPYLVPIMTSVLPSVRKTLINSSSSRRFRAFRPF